jgi:predicted PurR-regulated permease PerM
MEWFWFQIVVTAESLIFLAVLYFIGLLILGIKNAFLLSAIAALVTFIPYVGPIVGGLLPFTMALPFAYLIGDQKKNPATKDAWEKIKKKFKRKK